MTWLDKLERRFGFLAIPGLTRIVVGLTALVWGLIWLNPDFRFALDLDPARILHGEVWRLITYIFLPQTLSLCGSSLPSGSFGSLAKASSARGARSGSRFIFLSA